MANGMFAGGNGTAANPYLIEDAADLDAMRRNLTANYKLINNINLGVPPYNTGSGWAPIHSFLGRLNGNNKKIINLFISRADSDSIGLFGSILLPYDWTGLMVWDLALENVNIVGRDNVAGLFGAIGWTWNQSYIPGVVASRISVTGTVEGRSRVGGIIGLTYYTGGTTYCYWSSHWIVLSEVISICDLSSIGTSGERIMGGIIGYGAMWHHYNYNAGGWADDFTGGITNGMSFCTFKTLDTTKLGKSHTGYWNDALPAACFSNCFYDSNIHSGQTINANAVGYTTAEWLSMATYSTYKSFVVNGKNLYRYREGHYPMFWFSNQECYFVRVGKDYLTYDTTVKNWVKQFDALPSTPTILPLGMPTLDHLDTNAWNQLKTYGKVDIINFIEPTERLSQLTAKAILPLVDQPDGTMLCYKKEISFATFNSDIVSIAP